MMIHEITQQAGKYKSRKRVGRGHGSGHGKTCGRGHKGAASRSGATRSSPPAPGRLMSRTIRSGAVSAASCCSASSPDMAWPTGS